MAEKITEPDKRSLKERVNRGLAFVGIGAALGGTLAETAMANVDTVKKAAAAETAPDLETLKALRTMHERWNGVVVVTAPHNKNYDSMNLETSFNGADMTIGVDPADIPRGSTEIAAMISPGMIQHNGKLYLVGFNDMISIGGDPFGLLDVEKAEKAKAVKFFAYKGTKPGPMKYKIGPAGSASSKDLPRVTFYDSTVASDLEHLALTVQPATYDPNKHYKPGQPVTRELVPSNIKPHF